MRLRKLDSEQLGFVYAQAARGFKPTDIHSTLYQTYPDAEPYSVASISAAIKDEASEVEIEKLKEGIRDRALESSFAHQGLRVAALTELAEDLRDRLRKMKPRYPLKLVGNREVPDYEAAPISGGDPGDYAKLSSELRQVMRSIQQEMDPLAGAGVVVAPAQEFFEHMRKNEMTSAQLRDKLETEGTEAWSKPEVPS